MHVLEKSFCGGRIEDGIFTIVAHILGDNIFHHANGGHVVILLTKKDEIFDLAIHSFIVVLAHLGYPYFIVKTR